MSALPVAVYHNPVLEKLDEGRRALAEARSLFDAKRVRDVAKAAADLLKQQRYSQESVIDAMELKLWAERRMGEFLAGTVRHRGGKASAIESHGATQSLPEGITRSDSSRWQKEWSVPVELFEEYLKESRDALKEPTTAGVMRLAKDEKKAKKRQQYADMSLETCTVSDLNELVSQGKKFGTVYADPPWPYDNQKTRASTDNHYVTMSLDDIAALPVADLAAPQSHLHIWTTAAFLPKTFAIMEAWGFEYKSYFVWVKPQMGIGNYWRKSSELMLLGVRGGLTALDNGVMDWLETPGDSIVADRSKHSAKPEQVRAAIEKISPPQRLELFGRRAVSGWTVWGNEIEKDMFYRQSEESPVGG